MGRREGYRGDMQYIVLAAIQKNPRVSLRDLMEITGLRSTSAVSHHLQTLEADGLIDREARLSRSINLRTPTGTVERKDRRKNNSPVTRAKKSAAARKGKILEKGPGGIDAATWKRIEKIGKREDARKKKAHSTDVMNEYRGSQFRVDGLVCTKLG